MEGLRHRTVLHSSRKSLTDEDTETGGLTTSEEQSRARVADQATNVSVSAANSPSNSNSSDLLISWRRILLLIMAVNVHNFPEGLAVGVGFGSVGKTPAATFDKAFNLAIGIGLQNFPEGFCLLFLMQFMFIFLQVWQSHCRWLASASPLSAHSFMAS